MADYKHGDIIECTSPMMDKEGNELLPEGLQTKCLGVSKLNIQGEEYVSVYLGEKLGTFITTSDKFKFVETPTEEVV